MGPCIDAAMTTFGRIAYERQAQHVGGSAT